MEDSQVNVVNVAVGDMTDLPLQEDEYYTDSDNDEEDNTPPDITQFNHESSRSDRKLLNILSKMTLPFLEPFLFPSGKNLPLQRTFLLLGLKCLKFNCVTEPKLDMFSVIEVRPFIPFFYAATRI